MSYRPQYHRQARVPLTGADALRRTDNVNSFTTRGMRVLQSDGTAPAEDALMSIGTGGAGQMRFSQARLTADGSLDLPGTLTVAGATTLNGETSVAGAFNASGASTFTGAVTVDANTVINGNLTVNGTLDGGDIVKRIVPGTNMDVSPASGTGVITVGLAPTLIGLTGISVTGNLSAGGNVDAGGDGTFGGDLDVNGQVTAGSAYITGRLESTGFLKAAEGQIAGPLDVDGALEVKAGLTVTAGAIDALTSTVNAATGNFSNGLTVNNGVTLTGTVSVGEDLTVSRDLATNALDVTTGATVGADLTVSGKISAADLEISNGFQIAGAFQAQSAIIDTNLLVNGDLDVKGEIKHTRKFNPAIVADITAGEGIVVSHPPGAGNESIFIISAPGGGGGSGGATYNGGANIEITGSGPSYDINVDIDRDLDMRGYDIKNVDVIELVTTTGNAEDPHISFRNAGAQEAARIEFNQSNVIDPVLRVAGPLVEIEASAGATTTAGVKLTAGPNTLTLTTDRVQLGLPLLDICGAQIRYDGADLVLDNTNSAGGYKIDGILDAAAASNAADYTHILSYNNTTGEVRKMPVPVGVDISAGTNIAVDEIGTETVISLEVTADVEMAKQRLKDVGGIDLSGGASIDVSGTAVSLASGGTGRLVLGDAVGVRLAGVPAGSGVANVLAYDETTGAVTYQPDGASLSGGSNIVINGDTINLQISSDIDMQTRGIVNASHVSGGSTLTVGTAGDATMLTLSDTAGARIDTSNTDIILQKVRPSDGSNPQITTTATVDTYGLVIATDSIDNIQSRIALESTNGASASIQTYENTSDKFLEINNAEHGSQGHIILNAGGNVGVLRGNTVPTEKFEVDGRVKATGAVLTTVPTASAANPYVLTVDDTTGEIQKQLAGSGGGGGDLSLLLNQPAKPTGETTTPGSAEILIKWTTNPSQTSVNFMPEKLPRIVALKVQVAGGTTYTNTADLPGSASSSIDVVKGVVLIKGTGSNGIVTRGGEKVFAVYLDPATAPVSTFDIDIWYEGYGDAAANKLAVTDIAFTTGGGPSVPRNIATTSITFDNVTVSYNTPEFSDALNNLATGSSGAPAITKYVVEYTPQSAAKRYNGPYNTTKQTKDNISTLSTSLTGLYPDTTYSYDLWSVNSLGNTGAKASGTFSTETNAALAPTQFLDHFSLQFTQPTYPTPIFLSNGTQITDPVYFTTSMMGINTALTMNSIGPLPIHVAETRGSNADDIMRLSYQLNNSTPLALAVGGFGKSTGAVSSSTGVLGSVASSRADVGTAENSGFYQKERYQLQTNAYNTDHTQKNTLILTQSFPGTSVSDKSKIFDFYTDNLLLTATPIINGDSNTTVIPTITNISGLKMATAWNISGIQFIVDNISNTFTAENSVTYTFVNSSGTLVNKLSGVSNNSVTITGKTISGSIDGSASPAVYSLRPALTLIAKNTNNLTGTFSSAISSILVDTASLQKHAAITRVRSPLAAVKTSTTASDYTPAVYDQTVAVSASGYTHETLLHRGSFVGKGFTGAFVDYTSGSIGPDLSGTNGNGAGGFTTGYRYVTLEFAGPTSGNKLRIAITFDSTSALSAVNLDANGNVKKLQADGADIEVYYCTTGGSQTTRWINANSYENGDNLGSLSAISAAGTSLGAQVNNGTGLTLSGADATYTVFGPTPFLATKTYIMIGIPDSANTGVSTIQCSYL